MVQLQQDAGQARDARGPGPLGGHLPPPRRLPSSETPAWSGRAASCHSTLLMLYGRSRLLALAALLVSGLACGGKTTTAPTAPTPAGSDVEPLRNAAAVSQRLVG